MRNPVVAFVELVFPFFVGAVMVVIVWIKPPVQLSVGGVALGPVELDTYLEGKLLVGGFLTVAIVGGVLLIHLGRNYAKFFPFHIEMTVCFDHEGIGATIRDFTDKEIMDLRIENDWVRYNQEYISGFNEMLRAHGVADYAVVDQSTTGYGDFNYRAHKTRGWQAYMMTKAWGTVRFEFIGPSATTTIMVHYSLKSTASDTINATIGDLFIRFTKIIRPTLSQHVFVRPDTKFDIVDFVCPTKVRFFPVCGIGRTLYCAHGNVSGEDRLIPIAYAIYDIT